MIYCAYCYAELAHLGAPCPNGCDSTVYPNENIIATDTNIPSSVLAGFVGCSKLEGEIRVRLVPR